MLLTEILKSKNSLNEIHQLFEADKKKPTQTKLGDEVNMDDIFSTPKFNAPSRSQQQQRNVTKQQAGREGTRQAVSGVRMDPRSNELLGQLDQSGLEDDRPMRTRQVAGEPEPRPPGTDVAVRGQEVARRGQEVSTESPEPNWHKIEDLPGYMKSAVRVIGRQVFSPLTNTDIEDIDVIANLNGSGPNTDEEIRQVGAYLRRNGERQT